MLMSIISQLEERNPLVPPLRKRGLRGHPHMDSHTANSSMVPSPVIFLVNSSFPGWFTKPYTHI